MTAAVTKDRINQPTYYHRQYENDVKNLKPTTTFFAPIFLNLFYLQTDTCKVLFFFVF